MTCSVPIRIERVAGRTQTRRTNPSRFVVWTLLTLARKTRHRSSARCSCSLLLDPLAQRQAGVGVGASCSFRRDAVTQYGAAGLCRLNNDEDLSRIEEEKGLSDYT